MASKRTQQELQDPTLEYDDGNKKKAAENAIEEKDKKGETSGKGRNAGGPAQQEVRVLIENSAVGGIIGKAGAHVKRVRDETGVFVSILKTDNVKTAKERIMVLKGATQSVAKALSMIAQYLIDGEKKGTGQAAGQSDSTAIKLLVHRSAVGAVIGRQGAVIKETQSETNARVQVSNDPLPNSTEKTIQVTGTPAAIHAALLRILAQLKDNPIKPGTRVIAYIPGQPVFMPSMAPYGFPYQQQMMVQVPYGANAAAAAAAAAAQQHGHHPQQGGPQVVQQQSRQELSIPTICAGGIIGRGGSVIRDLRAQSGTNISIADPEPNNPLERVVTVSGTAQGIQTAVFLIQQLVDQYQPPANAQQQANQGQGNNTNQGQPNQSHQTGQQQGAPQQAQQAAAAQQFA